MSETTQPRGWTYANDKDGDIWRWNPGIEQMLYAASTWVSISNPQPDIRTFLSDLIIDPRPRDEDGRLVGVEESAPFGKAEFDQAKDVLQNVNLKSQLAAVTAERDTLAARVKELEGVIGELIWPKSLDVMLPTLISSTRMMNEARAAREGKGEGK